MLSRKTVLLAAGIAGVCMLATPAQTRKAKRAPRPGDFPLETFAVKGNDVYTREQILAVSRLHIGMPADKATFDAARDRIMATGAFESAGYAYQPAPDQKGYAVTFEVVEVSAMYPFRVEDLPATQAEIAAYLKQKDPLFGEKVPATKEALEHYRKLIADYLAVRKNYHEAIAGKLTPEIPPELTVLFRPDKPRPTIAHVEFEGSSVIPATTLQNTMAGVARGVPYDEPAFRLLLDNNIRPLYDAIGHVRVSFPKITAAADTGTKGVIVTVQVNEGPVYKLGAVHVQGVEASPVLDAAALKTGTVANFDLVKQGNERVRDLFRRRGYMQAESTVARVYHDQTHTVDVVYRVQPGPQFFFGKLAIVGLDIETEPAIRKLWGLAPGKPFNVDYPNHFLSRLKEEQIFNNLKSTRSENKVTGGNKVDVTLYFNK